MQPEYKAALTLFQSFDQDNYIDIDGNFDLSECKYHIREAVAETYLSAVDEAVQVDIVIDAFHKLQQESGREAIASTLFGSPLHGVKKLRELSTNETINRISGLVEFHLRGILAEELAEQSAM